MTSRDQQYIQELRDELTNALASDGETLGTVDLVDFIMDAERDLGAPAVAYAWGRLLGAAEMLDMTPLELFSEAGITEI